MPLEPFKNEDRSAYISRCLRFLRRGGQTDQAELVNQAYQTWLKFHPQEKLSLEELTAFSGSWIAKGIYDDDYAPGSALNATLEPAPAGGEDKQEAEEPEPEEIEPSELEYY